jgi:hypothetical protein
MSHATNNPQPSEASQNTSSALALAPGSAFSRKPLRVKPVKGTRGYWIYRNFRVFKMGRGHWLILSACGDKHPVTCFVEAMLTVDKWYKEGSVEY